LIKHYIGSYSVTHISTSLENNQIVSTTENIELEVKKSFKGIKIHGVKQIDNFDVNYTDSTFKKSNPDTQVSAYGKFHPNDSISLCISLSYKLPFAEYYRMKRK
jgi:hypothetical protein